MKLACMHALDGTILTVNHAAAHFRSIIENVSDVIAIIGPTASSATPCRRCTRSDTCRTKCGAASIYDFIHPSDTTRAVEFFAGLDAPAEAIELRFGHADGSPRLFEVVARNVVRKGQVTSVIATARAITERRKLQTQLATANRLTSLGRLAATVAHEFNVLMSGKRIAQDILRFTQPAEPALAPVKIDEWWSARSPEVAGMLADTIEIRTDFGDPYLCVRADASQLAQVFVNLLTNARDAMPQGGTVTITARRDEPLFTSKATGTGASRHPAAQRADLRREHAGKRDDVPHLASRHRTGHRSNQNGSHGRADPFAPATPAIMEGVVELLRDAKLEVSTAATGEEAVDAIEELEPDVVVLDYGVGADIDDRRTRYLQKPFEIAALLDAIAAVEAV